MRAAAELRRGTLNSGKTGISGTPGWEEDLAYDPTGNWQHYQTKVGGGLNRTHNSANEIATIADTTDPAAPAAATIKPGT